MLYQVCTERVFLAFVVDVLAVVYFAITVPSIYTFCSSQNGTG